MNKIKVIIADDSIVYRSQIKQALSEIPYVEIVASAAHGKIAIEKLKSCEVDLLILDLEMPEMDGLETLKQMKQLNLKNKVLVFSSFSKRGADITLEALKNGASDFITKPGIQDLTQNNASESPALKIKNMIEPKITALFQNKINSFNQSSKEENKKAEASLHKDLSQKSTIATSLVKKNPEYPKIYWDIFKPKVLVIGASTGGPTVLEKIFSEIPPELNLPIFLAQHMPPLFTQTLAERLKKLKGLNVKEAVHNEIAQENTVYVAPGDFHMRLFGSPQNLLIKLDQEPQINSVRPAVDPLFESAAQIFKDRCLGIVLTGMGADGKNGAIAIKNNHGAVVIQSEPTCVVFGMPGAVKEVGAFDFELHPDEIVQTIKDKCMGLSQFKIKNLA